jgi:hypothetical protein
MKMKASVEECILEEVRGLPVVAQKKVLRMAHLLRKGAAERANGGLSATDRFLALSGTWRDHRSVRLQIRDIQRQRRSRKRQGTLA